MELRRFYVTPEYIDGDAVTVVGDEYRHMTGVLRFKVGYKAIVCDNSGYDYYCTVTAIDKVKATLRIDDRVPNDAELPFDLTLCCGLIKPEKLEIEVQKAVEIGANVIRPFVSRNTSERSVRKERLERIVLEACKQCGRAKLPTVRDAVPFEALFDTDKPVYMAYEKEDKCLLRDALAGKTPEDMAVIIGSEGGFTDEEADFARQKGAVTFSLGKRIMRAETAAIVALGVVCSTLEVL